MRTISVTDPEDPRIAGFRDIRERDLTGRQGLFVGEGEVVVRVLASEASRCRPRALLLAEKRAEGLADVIAGLPEATPVYVAGQTVLDQIAGFPLHRGILALGEKPVAEPLETLLDGAGREDVFLIASGIGNHDNMGGLFRNAAAFGARAVLLDRACCDPFYRKSIRVSVGAVLRTPFVVADSADELVTALHARGVEVAALTPSATQTLAGYRPEGPVALMVGSEGPGLPRSVIDRCRAVGVPMAGGFDSLNVAVASALALHQVVHGARG
ncbi:RNA methyltransferase [Pseudomonas sp. ODNR1LW]|nr:RNA methyltransferase [Pseudomonas sp. ODNR1LW]